MWPWTLKDKSTTPASPGLATTIPHEGTDTQAPSEGKPSIYKARLTVWPKTFRYSACPWNLDFPCTLGSSHLSANLQSFPTGIKCTLQWRYTILFLYKEKSNFSPLSFPGLQASLSPHGGPQVGWNPFKRGSLLRLHFQSLVHDLFHQGKR